VLAHNKFNAELHKSTTDAIYIFSTLISLQ